MGLFLILTILAFPLIRGGIRTAIRVRALQAVSETTLRHLQEGDLSAVEKDLIATRALLPEMRIGLHQMGFWRFMPLIGVHIRAMEDATEASETTLAAVSDIVQVARILSDAMQSSENIGTILDPNVAPHRSFQDLSPEEKRTILKRLHDALPQLKISREKMAIALNEWHAIERHPLISPVVQRLHPLVMRLDSYKTALDQGIAMIETMIPLAGLHTPQTYLVVLQNADELRPTGGFIGTIGLVTMDGGAITHLAFQDVYALDGAVQATWTDQPPEILTRHLGVRAWFLRDSNWSPDFTVAAQRLMDVYDRELQLAHVPHVPVQGVIALQPSFFERLLRLTGPLSVQGKTFHAGNFFDQLEYDVEIGFLKDGKPVHQRKEIVSDIGAVLITRLMEQPFSRWPEILNAVVTSLEEKDVLVYARTVNTQRLLDAYQWTGRIAPASQDYLWVIDANLAALKTDGVMQKDIHYQLDARNSQQSIATVTLTYHNTNRQIDWRHTRYRDYVRVFVPEGSELVSSTGAMLNDTSKTGGRIVSGTVDVMHDLGKTVFGAFWSIEPGETRTLSFTYKLPSALLLSQERKDLYTLLVQRQPGAETRLTLDLNFGKNILSAVPGEDPHRFGDARYQTTAALRMDQSVQIRLSP